MNYEQVHVPVCSCCGGLATLHLTHGSSDLGLSCFACADGVMRELAVENVRGGSTPAATVQGYFRWRAHVGRPCSLAEATEALGKL